MVLERKFNYWTKNKQKFLPWVEDWTDPQDHIRMSNNVKDMSRVNWFYCHPTSYQLIYYGTDVIGIIFLLIAGWILTGSRYPTTALFPVLFAAYLTYSLVKKIKNYKNIKYLTFYDIYMREYPGENTNGDSRL